MNLSTPSQRDTALHKVPRSSRALATMLAAVSALVPLASAAAGAAGAPAAGAKADHAALAERNRQERTDCMNLQASPARDNCLEDAAVAYGAAQRRTLADVMPQYAQNALRRCDALAGSDKQDCLARMQGQGTTQGSVSTGGIYRELVTVITPPSVPVVPAMPGTPASAPLSSPAPATSSAPAVPTRP